MTVNEPFLREVLATIELNPERWNQREWVNKTSCGTTYCLAGWAYVLHTGKEPDLTWTSDELIRTASKALGLTEDQAEALFFYTAKPVFTADGRERFQRVPVTFDDLCAKVEEVTGVRLKPSPPVLE